MWTGTNAFLLEFHPGSTMHAALPSNSAHAAGASRQFREFADGMPHILWTAEPDGTVDYLNKIFTDFTGVALDVASQNWLQALHVDDLDGTIATWKAAVASGNLYSVESRGFDVRRGEYRWLSVNAKPVRDERGNITKWFGIATDIHERKVADERANLLASRLDATIGSMSDGFIMIDRASRVIYFNKMAERVLQRSRPALLGKVLWDEIAILIESRLYLECQRAWDGQHAIEYETFSPLCGHWCEVRIYPSPEVVSIYIRDIDSRKTAEAQIQRLAFHDQLTGLPNRQLLRERLQHALLMTARSGRVGAVMFIDLDNFKTLNDTQGHDKGDLLLQQLAGRLSACVGNIDTVARLGGDEFVVVLEDLSGDLVAAATQAELLGETILSALNRPCDLKGYQHIGTASIGVTLLDGQVNCIEEVLKRADLAMYRAKAAGRNAIRFYDPEMQTTIAAKMALETGLRDSLEAKLFTLYFQPQLDHEQRLIGAEALLRWTHPAHQAVPPCVFIPVAEETGLILELGRWVLEAACACLARWALEAATARLTLAVNVSAHQFRQPDFVADVLRVVGASGINPERLKLELTETALVGDIDDAVRKITALMQAGIRFSLDDFGTGYSSLSYLRFLPLEQLKIDRSFISRIPGNTNDVAVVEAIIAMAHKLGLSVIAEGVETEQQLAFLAGQGCNAYQGFLFSKPVPHEEFLVYVQQVRTGAIEKNQTFVR
jgi:diguanylate cyclase (GGDEF)-like protein/PAS domain S-box-containing protein